MGSSPGFTCCGDVHRIAGIADVAASKGHQSELIEGVLGEQRAISLVGTAASQASAHIATEPLSYVASPDAPAPGTSDADLTPSLAASPQSRPAEHLVRFPP